MKKKKIESRRLDAEWEISQDEIPESLLLAGSSIGEFTRPLGKKFWATGPDLIELLTNAGVISCWDMHTALGDTIREKYESLYHKLFEVTDVTIRHGASGYFWIAAAQPLAELLEHASGTAFEPALFVKGEPPFDNQKKLGSNEVVDKGTMNKRWRIFQCNLLPPD